MTRPPAKRRDLLPWLIFLLAAGERLAFLLGSSDRAWPFSIFYEGDAEAFYEFAQAILAGRPYDNGIPFHPPLFPLALAGLHGLLGDPVPHGILRAILAIASAIVPLLLFLSLRRAIGRGAALAAALLACFSFALDALGTAATSEGLSMILVLWMVLLAMAARFDGDARPRRRAALLGLLTGLAALARAEGVAAGLLIFAAWSCVGRSAPWRSRVAPSLFWVGALALVLAPWTIRNAVSLSAWNESVGRGIGVELPRFVPITSYGPLNFALANHDGASGGFSRALLRSKSEVAVLDLADPEHARHFIHGGEIGLAWISRRPGAFLRLAGRKIEIASRALDLGWTPWNLPLGRSGTRLPVDLFAPDRSGLRYAQILLAVAGAALLLRRSRDRSTLAILAAPIVALLAANVLFFGYVRLGALALPYLFALEGIALAALAARLPAGWKARIAGRWGVGIAIAAAIAILAVAATQDRNYTASGTSDRPGGKLIRDAPIRIVPIQGD